MSAPLRLNPALLALVAFAIWSLPYEPILAPLHAAVTVTPKLGEASTANQTSYTSTGSFSLASSTLGICFTAHRDADTAESVATVTHNSQGWTQIGTGQTFAASDVGWVSAWRIVGPQSSSTIAFTITGGADNQQGFIFDCYEIGGSETGAPLQSKFGATSATTTHTVTLDSSRTSNALLLSWFSENGTQMLTPEYANTGTGLSYATPDQQARVQWVIGGTDTTPTWTTGSNTGAGLIAVEIAEAAAAASVIRSTLLGVGP